MSTVPKRVPLYEEHQQLHARFTEFGGWDMPVQYTSIMDEHTAVRTAAGIFDTSHMGVLIIAGPESAAFLSRLTTADAAAIPAGKAKYALLLNEAGGVIDDLIIYRRQQDFLLVVNAGNTDKDIAWFTKHLSSGVTLENISDRICLFALQGPAAERLLQPFIAENLRPLPYFSFMTPVFVGKQPSFGLVARTGYTGEDGFEIFVARDAARGLWQQLVHAGAKPCGLGCRDTLRLEACMPLHGHEISDDLSPLEAGLGWAIAWDHDFIGRPAVQRQKAEGVRNHLFACTVATGIPRAGCRVRVDGNDAGSVVSGTYSPTLKTGIALGYSARPLAAGAGIDVVIHGQPRAAVVVQRPFYKRAR